MTEVASETARVEVPSGSLLPFMFASTATATAGFLDAVGYNQLDHLYVSFMSGNSTHFGMAIAAGEWTQAGAAIFLISVFVTGTVVGTLLLDGISRPFLGILIVELVFGVISITMIHMGMRSSGLILTALMMGMQNVVHQNVKGTDAGKGFITGALFGFGQSLARIMRGKGSWSTAAIYASTWLLFVSGVVCGTFSIVDCGLIISLLIALACLVLLICMALAFPASAKRTSNPAFDR